MSWSPVLTGQAADAARQSIVSVVEALPADPEVLHCDSDLPGGAAGYAITYAYAAKSLGEAGLMDRAGAFLDQAIDGISQRHSPAALHGGFVGVAWAATHLAALSGETDEADAYDEIDGPLAEYIDRLAGPINYDLISGLVGFGLYALERWPHPNAREIAKRVAQKVISVSQEDDSGVTWATPPERLPEHEREVTPDGYYNLGVAHGIPGIIGFLGRFSGLGGLDRDGVQVLERGVDWLLAQRSDLADGLHYPSWIPIGRDASGASRVAWCYGDLGLSAALRVAGECHGRRDWLEAALSIAQDCARVPATKSGVRDHGLCHGAAGNAHVFNRMAQSTGDPALRDAARFWYEETLATRQPGLGPGGYAAWKATKPEAESPHDRDFKLTRDPRLLTGSAGVAIALAAGISDVDPAWDRSFLVSSHPRERSEQHRSEAT